MTDTLRERLERACEGLVYSSESDRPFSFVRLGHVGPVTALTPADVAALIGAPGARAEEVSADGFLAQHLSVDPRDHASAALVPRYDALASALAASFAELRLFRVGTIEIRILALGNDPVTGEVAGLSTVAVET